jgi:hypothetical protein
LARTAHLAGTPGKALLLSEESLNIGRHVNDRFGQTITLQLQLEILQSSGTEMPVLALVVLLRNLHLETNDLERSALYEEILAQIKANMPPDRFTQLEQNAERIRADSINKVRQYYLKNNPKATILDD